MPHPLYEYRLREGLSQAALGRKLGVSRVTVSRWESGDRHPNERTVPKITRVTGIPASLLRPDLAKRYEIYSGAAA